MIGRQRALGRSRSSEAQLGDSRRPARLARSAELLAETPGHSSSASVRSDGPAGDGCYRIIEQPCTQAVPVGQILPQRRERSIRSMRGRRTVLRLQGGCAVRFATRPRCHRLGVIGRSRPPVCTLGIHPHPSLAATPRAMPLEVLRSRFPTAGNPQGGCLRMRLDGYRDWVEA